MAKNSGMAQVVDWQAIEREAENGEVTSMLLLGMRAGARRDASLAERWMRAAAVEGHIPAMVLLGGLLAERGRIDEGVAFWQAAAAAGENDAIGVLGMLDPSHPGKTKFKLEYRNVGGIVLARVRATNPLNPSQKLLFASRRLFAWLKLLFRTVEVEVRLSAKVVDPPDDLTVAAVWYERRGYQIIDRAFRNRHLVVFSEGQFVFCEVERRERSARGDFPDAATNENRESIRFEARVWLSQMTPRRLRRLGLHQVSDVHWRFDLVSMLPHGFEVIEGCY